MKNALLLHGTSGNSEVNWLPWLKNELEANGWIVWVPNLPNSDHPNIKRYNDSILKNKNWVFDKDSIIIGHSSGAVAALGLLQSLPDDVVIDKAILVASFKNDLGWESLQGLFSPSLLFEKIKKHAKSFIFIHSDDDPYCPLEHAQYLNKKLNGKLIVKPGQKHFNTETAGEKYRKFPFILELLD